MKPSLLNHCRNEKRQTQSLPFSKLFVICELFLYSFCFDILIINQSIKSTILAVHEDLNDENYQTIISAFGKLYDQRIEENLQSHQSNFSGIGTVAIEHLSYYLSISTLLKRDVNKAAAISYYIDVIADGFYVIKSMFEQGFHIHLQSTIRYQYELLNVLLAVAGNKQFSDLYFKEIENHLGFKTPKHTSTKKSIKDVYLRFYKDNFNEVWGRQEKMMSKIYSELSKTAHGNILYVGIQSFEGNPSQPEVFSKNDAGVKYPLPVTIGLTKYFLNYVQYQKTILFKVLENEGFIDKSNLLFETIKNKAQEFDILNNFWNVPFPMDKTEKS